MRDTELERLLEKALAGRSPERAVQDLGLPYNQARTIRNALEGNTGWGKKALGILILLCCQDAECGPTVIEYLRQEARGG